MLAIIQARMSSSRLPGKMLRKLGDMTLIDHVYCNLDKAKNISKIIIATSDDESDSLLADHCNNNNIPCFRGDLQNVASRFHHISNVENDKAFVRISGDSPIIDPKLVDELINVYNQGQHDLVTNVLKHTYPKGQSVEVISSKIFQQYYPKFNSSNHLEHVTSYFYDNADSLKIKNVSSGSDFSEINLSIDTLEDFTRIEKLTLNHSNCLNSWRDSAIRYRELFLNA